MLDKVPYPDKNVDVSVVILSAAKVKNSIVKISLLLIVIGMFVCAVMIAHRHLQKSQYWPGWYLLCVPSEVDEKKVIEALQMHGIDDAKAPSTTTVQYMAIPDMQSITIDQIDDVLIKGDPRRDPFLHNVESLFRSGDSSIIYLPAFRGIVTYRKIIKQSPILENAILFDDMRNGNLFVVLLFALLAGE